MSELLKKYWSRLELVASIKRKKLREDLLKELGKDEDFCKVIRELSRNTIKRNIPFKPVHIKQLKVHKGKIRKLAKKTKPLAVKTRQDNTVQAGGFLPVLIPIVATLLGEFLRGQ